MIGVIQITGMACMMLEPNAAKEVLGRKPTMAEQWALVLLFDLFFIIYLIKGAWSALVPKKY